jgi:hydroxypyruvate isomerase
MKQSFCLPCFRSADVPLDALLREARSIGYAATEIWAPGEEGTPGCLEEVADAAGSAGLAIASFTGHESIDNGLNDPAEADRIEAELIASLDRAARVGVPGIICFSGTRRPGVSDAEGLAHFVRNVRRVIRHAEEREVNLNLEVLNSRVDHPRYMADTVDWAIAACAAVESRRLRVLFDVYHVQIMEGDVVRRLRRAAPFLGHIHTAGNPGRHELDDGQELNYRFIANELRTMGYDGYIGHELFPRGNRLEALRGAYRVCAP